MEVSKISNIYDDNTFFFFFRKSVKTLTVSTTAGLKITQDKKQKELTPPQERGFLLSFLF